MVEKYNFEILCVDPHNKTVLQTPQNVIYALMANFTLWESPILIGTAPNLELQDEDILIAVKSLKVESSSETLFKRGFSVKCSGPYERLEKIRLPICQYLKSLQFEFLYIVQDEVSEYIAQQMYPSINKVENRLRKYIIKFFITKLGPSWWDVTADAEMKKKASSRQKNEPVFGSHIDNKIYLIDFGELGKIVYQQSSGYISREDIIKKINNIDNSADAVEKLKEELQSNYIKFFKESFKERNFQQQWEEVEKLRNKVAHNNLFTEEDLRKCQESCNSLLEIIEEATSAIENIDFSLEDLETIKSNIIELANPYKVISEDELLKHLKERQDYYSKTSHFVELSSFVKEYLGSLGYDYSASHSMISQLQEQKKIKVYSFGGTNGEQMVAIQLSDLRRDRMEMISRLD
jgi:hypothetical protein